MPNVVFRPKTQSQAIFGDFITSWDFHYDSGKTKVLLVEVRARFVHG